MVCRMWWPLNLTYIFKVPWPIFSFWLGIRYDSIVWVIMRRRGVSSERRRYSCSSLKWLQLSLLDIFGVTVTVEVDICYQKFCLAVRLMFKIRICEPEALSRIRTSNHIPQILWDVITCNYSTLPWFQFLADRFANVALHFYLFGMWALSSYC